MCASSVVSRRFFSWRCDVSEPTKNSRIVFLVLMVMLLALAFYLRMEPKSTEDRKIPANEKILVNTPMRTDAELAALYQYRITTRQVGFDERGHLMFAEERAYTNDWKVRIVTEKMLYAPTLHKDDATTRVDEIRIGVKDAVLQQESKLLPGLQEIPGIKREETKPSGDLLVFGDSWTVEITDTRTGKVLFQEQQGQPNLVLP